MNPFFGLILLGGVVACASFASAQVPDPSIEELAREVTSGPSSEQGGRERRSFARLGGPTSVQEELEEDRRAR